MCLLIYGIALIAISSLESVYISLFAVLYNVVVYLVVFLTVCVQKKNKFIPCYSTLLGIYNTRNL